MRLGAASSATWRRTSASNSSKRRRCLFDGLALVLQLPHLPANGFEIGAVGWLTRDRLKFDIVGKPIEKGAAGGIGGLGVVTAPA